jgi:hypothetical protein
MITFFNFVGVMFIILLVIAMIVMKKELDYLMKKFDGFDRPSLNRDINYTILGLCLLSCLIGGVFTMIILGV